ncbi:MAG TPA: hypothetical protein VGF13_01680 [Verrucomicrobiae bacterium]
MKRGTITGLLGGVIVAGFSLGAFAELKDNPYQVIIDRNPFGLKPIPPPPPPADNTPPPPPALEIKLTGLTTLLGAPRVFLELTDPQSKKVDRPPPLAEGESFKDSISIVAIDTENGRVKIKKGDAETTLDFDKDGLKPGGAVAAAAPVPHPGLPGLNPVPPVPGAPTASLPGAGPARGAVVGGATPTAAPATFPGAPSFPSRPLRTDTGAAIVGGYGVNPTAQQHQQVQAQPSMTREQAEATIELRRQELLRQNPGAASILPPTGLQRALNSSPIPAPTPKFP